jgi:NADH dehydrogenase
MNRVRLVSLAMPDIPHVVIVGGGFGGLTTAKSLGRVKVRVTLVDRANHHLFQPLLYQVAMAGLSPADIAVPIRSVLSKYENAQVLLADVDSIDLSARHLRLDSGKSLSYDYLVVSVGAKTNYFGHDDWTRHALGLKTLDDAVEIRRRVLLAFEAAEREEDPVARKRLLTFVVIGGGPTGVEIAGSLVELGRFVLADDFRRIRDERVRVVLIEATERLLPGGFHPKVATRAKEQLEELGAEVRLGSRVVGIDSHGVSLENGTIEASTVLWTAGVRAKRLAETLGVELDRAQRVKVLRDCSLPGYPEAFAIGDVACFIPEGSEHPLPGVSPVAMQQGRFVARVIGDRVAGRTAAPEFRYFDKGIMATIGRSRAVAQMGKLELSGVVAWLAWLFVHIFYLIDFRNRLAVLLNWSWSYITYRRGARLITGDRPWERAHLLANAAQHLEERARLPTNAAPAETNAESRKTNEAP